jgi:hypothetical protein
MESDCGYFEILGISLFHCPRPFVVKSTVFSTVHILLKTLFVTGLFYYHLARPLEFCTDILKRAQFPSSRAVLSSSWSLFFSPPKSDDEDDGDRPPA